MLPIKIVVGILPVLLFLATLVYLDSYKLVKPGKILTVIMYGCLIAVICLFLHKYLLNIISIKTAAYTRYISPVIEELLKGIFIIILIRGNKIGFMVDAAIFGFAIGTGFACIENAYYLNALESSNISLWVVRGFGTAIMHGGVQAIFAIIAKSLIDRKSSNSLYFLPGLLLAIVIHSFYNQFIFSPILGTILIAVFLPLLFMAIFSISEKATTQWLGEGMDSDIDLIDLINAGEFDKSNIGIYLESLRARFDGPIVADMLCYLRIFTELALRAKGILMSRQYGLEITPEPEVKAKFDELKYLEKSIGKTGKLAITPFLGKSKQNLWQIHMLKEQ